MIKKTLFVSTVLVIVLFIFLSISPFFKKEEDRWPLPPPLTSNEIKVIASCFDVNFPISTSSINSFFQKEHLCSLWCKIVFDKADLENFMASRSWNPPGKLSKSKINKYTSAPLRLYYNSWACGGGEKLAWWEPKKERLKHISEKVEVGTDIFEIIILVQEGENTSCLAYLYRISSAERFPNQIFKIFRLNQPNWDLRECIPYVSENHSKNKKSEN